MALDGAANGVADPAAPGVDGVLAPRPADGVDTVADCVDVAPTPSSAMYSIAKAPGSAICRSHLTAQPYTTKYLSN